MRQGLKSNLFKIFNKFHLPKGEPGVNRSQVFTFHKSLAASSRSINRGQIFILIEIYQLKRLSSFSYSFSLYAPQSPFSKVPGEALTPLHL